MEVFYLKVNQQISVTWHYLKMWLDIVQQFPDTKTYIICDDPHLQNAIINKINNGGGYNVEFIPSTRNSEELRYIIDNAMVPYWKPAAYAQLTTFLHARDNGYKNFWNIDADDLGLYVKPRRVAKLLKVVKNYATEHKVEMFSLDMWYTIHSGNHWSFGITYVDNSVNWIELMKSRCQDDMCFEFYGNKVNKLNADFLCTHLMKLNDANIQSFYVENLYIVHHSVDAYRKPFFGLKYCANRVSYWPLLCRDFGMGDKGSLPVREDVVKFDIGITEKESQNYLKAKTEENIRIRWVERVNALVDASITVILPLDDAIGNIRPCLESILSQDFKVLRVVVVDSGLNGTALEICRRMENQFDGRMKILTDVPKEKIFEVGIQEARGRYVMILNGNAVFPFGSLKTIYDIAEHSQADVVHISNFLVQNSENAFSVKTNEPGWGQNLQVSFTLKRLNDKLKILFNNMVSLSVYNKLIRREFLDEEKISIPFADIASQFTFSLQCLMLAENYVRIPYPLYVLVSEHSPRNHTEDFFTKIKSLAKCIEVLEKMDDEVFYFDEYAEEKNLLRKVYNDFLNEVLNDKHGKS